jgi:acid phosphatase type 7
MTRPDRRSFLGTSAGGLAALLAAPAVLLGKDPVSAVATFKPDTLFLTWHTDPSTTMVVQWVSDAPDDSGPVVYYGKSRMPGWEAKTVSARPFPLSPGLTVFRCELTGLTPGTDYRFCIGSTSPVYKFRTMPAKLTDEFTFVSGGDCGVNEHVVNNNKVAAKQDPYFAVIGGDLGYDNGTDAKAALGFLRNYTATMTDSQGRLIPMVVCVGNHEVKGGYGRPRTDAPFFFALFDGLFPEVSYATLDFGDYLSLLLLDTGHVAKIDGDQTAWLDLALKNRAERPHLIAVQHVPCYPSFRAADGLGGKAGTGDLQRKHWVPLYERHSVDLVLEHHDHTFKRTHPLLNGHKDERGVLYLGDGSWGKLRSAAKAESRAYIASASTSYHLTVHRIEGDERFHMAVDEFGKIVDVCRTAKKRGHT